MKSKWSGQIHRLRHIDAEHALVIIFFCARCLQVVADAKVEGEVRFRFPIVLHKARKVIPAVVVRNQCAAQSDVAVGHAQQKAGKRLAACAGGGTVGIGLNRIERILSTQCSKQRDDVLQRMGNINTEFPAHSSTLIVKDVSQRIAFFAILNVG